MNLNYYIIEFFIKELNLDEGSPVAGKLKRIRNGIYLFLIVNAITSFYAFNSLFGNIFIASLATIIYQFIFLMVYIVLFATVRKADFQKKEPNVKIKIIEKINDIDYSATKFDKVQPGLIGKINAKGWGKIIFRSILLLSLGIGPAFFSGIMVHHFLTNESYEIAKQTFIENQIKLHLGLKKKSVVSTQKQLDSLKKSRQVITSLIDSLGAHPDPNGYYKEDIAWYQSRLANFDLLNGPKIKRYTEKITTDSIANIDYVNQIRNHYNDANFFQLRSSVTWKHFSFTYLLIILLYLILLYRPFFIRYRLLIKQTQDLDDKLEAHYVDLITKDFQEHVYKMQHSNIVRDVKNFLNVEQLSEKQKLKFNALLDYFSRIGHHYEDPAVKAKEKVDPRIFIDKGHLGKYLGKQ